MGDWKGRGGVGRSRRDSCEAGTEERVRNLRRGEGGDAAARRGRILDFEIRPFGRDSGEFRGLLRGRSKFETFGMVGGFRVGDCRLAARGAWGHSFLAARLGGVGGRDAREAGGSASFSPPLARLDLFVGRRRSDLTWYGLGLDGLDLLLSFF